MWPLVGTAAVVYLGMYYIREIRTCLCKFSLVVYRVTDTALACATGCNARLYVAGNCTLDPQPCSRGNLGISFSHAILTYIYIMLRIVFDSVSPFITGG